MYRFLKQQSSFTLSHLRPDISGLRRGKSLSSSSFTLVELLIVIGILAILTAAVVIVLNPAELLKQSRDSTRMTDLASLDHAIRNLQTQSESVFTNTTAQTLYISLPDTSSTCSNLGLPALPSGYSYHCVPTASSTQADGSGWLPINFTSSIQSLTALPRDPVNTTSSGLYYAYIANPTTQTFSVYATGLESTKYQAVPASDGGISSIAFEKGTQSTLMPPIFPYGDWIRVPGNGTFATADFYVMKYEAKCMQNNTPLGSGYDAEGYYTYSDSTYPCTSANNKYITSTASGYPIARISHTTAKTYCTSIGAHLITNDEWMTIARNIEQQPINWSGGTVGSGYLYSGHNDGSPTYALGASNSDADGYYQTGNTSGNQKRTLTLSNNRVIWDLAGNMYEHIQRSINNTGDVTTTIDLPACSDGVAAWGWCQYDNTTTPYISSWTSDVVQNKVGSSNTSWNYSQGVGKVFTYKDGTDQGTTVFLRSAHWSDGSPSGIFSLYLGFGISYTGVNVGFRCAR